MDQTVQFPDPWICVIAGAIVRAEFWCCCSHSQPIPMLRFNHTVLLFVKRKKLQWNSLSRELSLGGGQERWLFLIDQPPHAVISDSD